MEIGGLGAADGAEKKHSRYDQAPSFIKQFWVSPMQR